MATPPMLRFHDGRPAPTSGRVGPAASTAAALLAVLCVGLLLAGVLAVATYSTPDAEGPLVLTLSGLFGLTLVVLIGSAAVRAIRPRRS